MGDDYVDYTLLKKKGILKLKEEKLKSSLRNEDGFVDLTPFKNEVTSEPSSSSLTNSTTTNTSNFGFLGDMASIGASGSLDNSSNVNNNTDTAASDGSELAILKVKLDDMEYKLERFLERIDKLEESLKNSK